MADFFADSSFWIARITPDDEFHELATEYAILLENDRIVTTQLVLNEVLNPRSGTTLQHRQAAITLIDRIKQDLRVIIVPQTPEQFEAAFNRLRRRVEYHRLRQFSGGNYIQFYPKPLTRATSPGKIIP